MKRWIWIAIIVVIGAAVIAMLGDVRVLVARLDGFGWWAFAAALGLALANYTIRFARWSLYLRRQAVRVPLGSSALVFGAGLSLSITPGKLGELIKSYLLHELHGVPATRTAPIVVAERVTDLIALLLLAVAGVVAYDVAVAAAVAAALVIGVGLILLAWPRPTRALIDLATRAERLRRFRPALHDMYGGLAALCRPATLVTATALAVPAWACECVGFALIVNAFPGEHVALGLAMVIYAGTTIAGALSFLPGGLGVTDGAMAMWLVRGAAGLDRSSAVDATLLTRLATLWFAVGLGLVCLAAARRRVRVRAQSAPAA
ncbi:MAG TPA: lysylphosphatidylglycerol synthase transmembrane domain-containing protein [Kofleriaceae bacterium]|nr:lysylphosphatidylglycerol synthase transmembrane domain-containing protein [Kofleriaceae bacterium]